jgi:geranylgeranyl diphosphate synthase, type II
VTQRQNGPEVSDLAAEMRGVKSAVDRLILKDILPGSSPVGEVDLLYKMMRDYPSRQAKGMRPFLCVTTCKAAGGDGGKALLTAACIELFQHWILIHDDIEDGSELRRGGPALHVKHGVPLAINAGDALHARMWGALSQNSRTLGAEKTVSIFKEFSHMVNETTEGQHMELGWIAEGRWDLKESDYFDMCTKKTSWYTVAGPCRLGAIAAGAPDKMLAQLRDFGMKLGVAFQIQDDALNIYGDQKKYGKAKSDDILEGKRTLMLIHLLNVAGEEERNRLIAVMSKERGAKTAEDVSYVLSLIERHDAVGYARKRAMELMKESLSTLREVEWRGDETSAALLARFARFAVEREW